MSVASTREESNSAGAGEDIAVTVVWRAWQADIPQTEIEPTQVSRTDIVVPTTDTIRNVSVVRALIHADGPFILCGPPGS